MATDFARLDAMKDEDIDCSDIPALTKEELDNAEWITTDRNTETAFLSISRDVMQHFRDTGKGYMMRLSRLVDGMLKDYIAQHTTEEVI